MSPRTKQDVDEALNWAAAEAESRLRDVPAHRLRPQGDHAWWLLDALNGIAVHVEVTTITVSKTTATATLVASMTGLRSLVRPHRIERKANLPLDGAAARLPRVLYLVFDDDGHVYAFESLNEAAEDLESLDLPSLTGAFSDQGELISMTPGDLFVKFTPTGTYDLDSLRKLMRTSRASQDLTTDPHRFALHVWLNT